MKPPVPGSRILALDGVRGVAVMGILAMNVVAFALPRPAYFNPEALGPASTADLISWFAAFVLFDGKMRGLFSLLFGASMLLVIERAEAAGLTSETVHFRRMAWLLVFGLLHFYLIWDGDILALYAVMGMAAWFFHDRSPRALVGIALVLLLAEFVVMASSAAAFFEARAAAAAPGAPPHVVAAWSTMKSDFAPPQPQALAETLALYRGSYFAIASHRAVEQGMLPLLSVLWYGCETLAYMLLGMAALKTGFLTGAWKGSAYRWTAVAGFGLGIPLFTLLAAGLVAADFDVPTQFALAIAAPILVKPALVAAIAATILIALRPGGALTVRVAAAGRAAFTNYLGASLLMTGLFYGYGAGLYGMLGRAQLWSVVLATWVMMLLWSKPWLDRFRYGPFEWLWRSLARGERQPMRRTSPPK